MSSLFSPSLVRDLSSPGYSFKNITRNDLTGTMSDHDSIWRDDPYGTGLKSSQQVNVDWSDFSKHTFFNNAESKVNVAYDRIINNYPFDGSKKELDKFIDSLSGFEKYVFDGFPKFLGDLEFTKASEQTITLYDKSGYLFPEISRNVLGQRNIASASNAGQFTIEFWIYASSSVTFDNQTLFQKLSSTSGHGISVFLSQSSAGASTLPIIFGLSSGSNAITASMDIIKGRYNHVACTYNNQDISAIKMYRDSLLIATSSLSEIQNLDFVASNVYIGSGSSQQFDTMTFVPKETLDVNIDELRFWKIQRIQPQINEFYQGNVFQEDDLALYYRFNEPTGSYGSKALALDHSGNGLHGQISNYQDSMRGSKYQSELPMVLEMSRNSPVLFPDYPSMLTINADLLTSASMFDHNNPNSITKLIPRHYFLEGQAHEGLENEFGELGDAYGYHDETFPGDGRLPPSQVLSSFLFVWASFFDEIKLYLDAFSTLHDLDHQSLNSIPAQFLHNLARRYGIELPNSFSNAKISGYTEGKNLTTTEGYSTLSLRDVQETLWRRLLAEMPNIQRSKGTIHSVRSLMLSLGVDPDSSFRIREFGGPKTKRLQNNRSIVNGYYNSLDFSIGTPFLSSSHLIAYRHEPGHPYGGPIPETILIDHMGGHDSTIKVATPGQAPTLTSYTSSSWAWEAQYVLGSDQPKQSLFRIESSGSNTVNTSPSICVNLLAVSGSETGNSPTQLILDFYGSQNSKLAITGSGINVFDGDPWYINVNHLAYPLSSSFVVRAYKSVGSDILESHYFSGSYMNSSDTENRLVNISSGKKNFIAIGSSTNYANELLNSYNNSNTTVFTGKLAAVRFWTKALELNESKEHALNPFSVGVNNPLINYNFINPVGVSIAEQASQISSGSLPLGSWERLRLSSDLYQETSSSNANGYIGITDTSQNPNSSFSATGFTADIQVFSPIIRMFSRLDPNYDISININKARIRSVQDIELAEDINAVAGYVYSLDPREPITDDRRFSVEASIVQALNEDMINILADNRYINDAMGTPEQMFAVNYPGLERLSDKYFNRLTGKINTTEYFKFFKWFDNNFGSLIEKIIPRTTEFLGINFVIESHMFERHKLEYKQADIHIDLSKRLAARIEPLFEGSIRTEST